MPYASERELVLALACLTAVDLQQGRWFKLPALYEAGVRYQREAKNSENWQTAVELLRSRAGDCEDLGCYRAAELRRAGERARAIPIRWSQGWHIVVVRGNGQLEDPSYRLGMKVGPTYREVMARAQLEVRS